MLCDMEIKNCYCIYTKYRVYTKISVYAGRSIPSFFILDSRVDG
jgi:hypothetical protein